MPRNLFATVCLLVVPLVVPQFAIAQHVVDQLTNLSLEELLNIKITSSTQTDETLLSVPSSVTVFTHQDIARLRVDTLEQLMNFVPGFQSRRSSESPLVETFSARGHRLGTTNREVLVVIDGRRLNSDWTGGSLLYSPLTQLDSIEKIEFIRGPGSAVYGANAYMGVINITSARQRNNISLSTGSFASHKAALNLGRESNEQDIGYSVQAYHFGDEGEPFHNLDDSFSPSPLNTRDAIEGYGAEGKVLGEQFHIAYGFSKRLGKDFYELDRLTKNFSDNYRRVKTQYLNLGYEFQWHQAIESKLNLWASEGEAEASLPFSVTPMNGLFYGKEKNIELNQFNNWRLSDEAAVQFGIEYRNPEITHSVLQMGDTRTEIGETNSRRNLAAFSQYQYRLNEHWKFTLGGRYDDYQFTGSSFSPRLGAIYQPDQRSAWKLIYGEAFRAPSRSEMDYKNNPAFIGNPTLKPETVNTWELIYARQITALNLSISYFRSRMDDIIVQQPNSQGQISRGNADSDKSNGIEIELTHQLNENWLVRSTYTLMDKPEVSLREAETLASLEIAYNHNKWQASVNGYYQGTKEFIAPGNVLQQGESLTMLNASIDYQFNEDTRIFFSIKNLLDTEHFAVPEANLLEQGVPIRGRNGKLGVEYRF